jgi:uncharacterized membrane protein YkvA (DUF1232 family)
MTGIPHYFAAYLTRAAQILRSPRLMARVVQQAARKLEAEGSLAGALNSVRMDLQTSLSLVRAWLSGRYSGVSPQSIVLVVAGLVYLLTPVDALPDVLPGIGFVDDVAVLSFVFGQLRQELAAFTEWLDQSADAAGRVARSGV